MRTFFKLILLMIAAMAVLAVIGGTFAWSELGSHMGSHMGSHSHATISINGEDLDVSEMHAVPWLGAVLGMFIAGLVICLVVPFVLLLSVGLPLLILALVFGGLLLGVVSVGAVVFSPFILLVLLAVWLLRRANRKAKANIAA